MSPFFRFIGSIWRYKFYTLAGIFFHILTALLTVIGIPLVIPFFQILFGVSPSDYSPPDSFWDLEAALNYGFSRLIAMTDHFIALQFVCIVVLVIFLLKNVSRYLISHFMIFVRNALLRDLRMDLWSSMDALSLQKKESYPKGYLLSLFTNDLAEVDHGILKIFELLFKTPLIILGSILFMLWLNLKLTLIAFGLVLFTLLIIGRLSHSLKKPSGKAQSLLATLSIVVDQYLSATKLIRTHHSDGYLRQKFQALNESLFKVSNRILRKRDLASPLSEFLGVGIIVVLLYFGTLEVLAGSMEPATFFAFIFAFYNIIDPAKSFSREYANVQRGIVALERINTFQSETGPSPKSLEPRSEATFNHSLSLRNVSFSYHDDHSILNHVNLQLNKGEKIGLVGASGAGKTTIIDLILGFYQPNEGEILLDDQKVTDAKSYSYRSRFGLITQSPHLFHGTVRENIVMGKAEDTERLNEVVQMVGLNTEFLEKHVGDGATMISGGEAQRVCLARVIYRHPEIVILDEPTSQLDRPSEKDLLQTLADILSQKTVLMITHHVELLRETDQIFLLQDGRIDDHGQYEDLYERNEVFRRLIGQR